MSDHIEEDQREGKPEPTGARREAREKPRTYAKPLTIAGLCLAAMVVMSMAVSAATASAASVWEGCLEGSTTTKYESSSCVKALSTGKFGWKEITNTDKVTTTGFTITLTDTKTAAGRTTVICTAGGEEVGTVGPGDFDRIEAAKVKEAKTNCRGTGGCKETGVEEVVGVHLPWQTKLSETEKKVLDTIENSGAGEPGWKVKCESILGKETDECESEGSSLLESAILENKLTGGVQLVSATFQKAHLAKCSKGGAKSGEVAGRGAILLSSGAGLRVSGGGGGGGGEEATSTSLTTSLTGESEEGEEIEVLENAGIKDHATLSGTNAAKAGGTVKYKVYSEKECKTLVAEAGEVTVTDGSVPASNEEKLKAGTYYWQASYSGDSKNKASTSACGSEIAVVHTYPASESLGGSNPGAPTVLQCDVGDAVDCATGNLTETQTDLSIGGRGTGLLVARTYNSHAAAAATEKGPFGYGWSGPYGAHLVAETEKATVYQNNGSTMSFHYNKVTGAYTPRAWTQATLAKEGSGYVYTLPEQTKLEFNSEGRLTKETDRNGNSITLEYNTEKNIETATDGGGRKLTFNYTGGQVTSIEDPMGHVVKYTYESGNLATVTLPGETEKRWKCEYNTEHELTKLTDGRKNSVTNTYNASHQATKQVQAGHERKWEYETEKTTLTEPNGSKTVEQFNAEGEPMKITRASGNSELETTTEYEYNSSLDNTAEIDPNKHVTKFGYDSTNDKTSETDLNGDERKWTYDKTHDIETETTPEGETTTIKRNNDGDPDVSERPIGTEKQVTEYKYTEKGEIYEMIDPLGHTTKYTYDAAGDKESETDPESNERKWKDNKDSQVIEETSPRKFTTTTERNEQGRPLKITDPLKHTTEYKYDGNGNIESETDGNKHTTEYVYNEENLPVEVKEANGNTTKTEYDSEGKMTAHIDGNGHKWEYKRNALEQVVEEKNPLGKVWKKKYEKAGNLENVETPDTEKTTYKYDESNRLKEIESSTGKPSKVTFEYTKDSKVEKMTDETKTTENTYDKLDRLTEYKNGAGKVVKYEYNLANEPTVITYPNKEKVTRSYDKDNRLEKVKDWKSNETTFSYNPDSELEKTTFPASTGDKDRYAYNEGDQMSEIEMDRETEKLATLVYERDGDNQVKKTTATGLPGSASGEDAYDESNRLTEANTLAYKYDKANNPTELEGSGTYAYNAADELETGPSAKYTYNGDGERTEAAPTKGMATTYGYDQAGNLTSVKRTEETEKPKIEDSFTYDGNNLRQSQDINGTTTDLTWNTAEGLPVVLEDETNSYIYGPDNLPVEQISSGGTTLYIHHDQQGSTRLLTGTTGKNEAAFTYSPYGETTGKTGTATTPLGYDSQYTSPDTGLIYLRARTYDPKTAQFLSVDPAEAESGEPYSYADDNPLNAADPNGLLPTTWGTCGQSTGSLGPVEVGWFSVCSLTSRADWGVTVTFSGALALDRQVIQRVRNWLTGQGGGFFATLAAATAGVGVHGSNATLICALAGPFGTARGSLGWGPFAVSYEEFWGANNISGSTTGLSYGWGAGGPGVNGGGAAGVSYTFAWSSRDGIC